MQSLSKFVPLRAPWLHLVMHFDRLLVNLPIAFAVAAWQESSASVTWAWAEPAAINAVTTSTRTAPASMTSPPLPVDYRTCDGGRNVFQARALRMICPAGTSARREPTGSPVAPLPRPFCVRNGAHACASHAPPGGTAHRADPAGRAPDAGRPADRIDD